MQHTWMNEKLYSWTFNFHKVVRQQNSGAVEDFILPYSAVYLRIQKWKNYWNWSTIAKVIGKIKVARFFMAHGVHIPFKKQALPIPRKSKFYYYTTISWLCNYYPAAMWYISVIGLWWSLKTCGVVVPQIRCMHTGYYQNPKDCTQFVACLFDHNTRTKVSQSGAPTTWNSLPFHIRNSFSIFGFRRQLKKKLFSII